MFARCARTAPACMRLKPGSEYLISRCFSAWVTVTPRLNGRLREPLAPFMVTDSAAMVAVTPCGRLTGALAILDMKRSSRLGHDAQDFAALSDRTRLFVRHHALGRGDDHRAHPAEILRQLVLAAVDPQARAADALDAVDDGTSLEILQANRQRRLRAVGFQAIVRDITLVLQHLRDSRLQLRRRELDFGLARGLAVADASQQIGNGVGHAHTAFLTSSPSQVPGSLRGSRLRESSRGKCRTYGTHHGG